MRRCSRVGTCTSSCLSWLVGRRRLPPHHHRMSASSWDLWKLFLSSPIIVLLVVALALALCAYVDHLLDGGRTDPETAEDQAGKEQATTVGARKSGKEPGNFEDEEKEEEEEEEEAESEVENEEDDDEEFPLITLGPLFSWLMEESVLYDFCEQADESSASEPVAAGQSDRASVPVKVRQKVNSDASAGKIISSKARGGLTGALVSFEKSGTERQTSGDDSSKEEKVSFGKSRMEYRGSRIPAPVANFPAPSDGRRVGRKMENQVVVSTTTGKTQANDDFGKIPAHDTERWGQNRIGYVVSTPAGNVQVSDDVGKTPTPGTERCVFRCDGKDSLAFPCRQCFVSGASCDCIASGYRKSAGCWHCDVPDSEYGRSGAHFYGFQRQPACCYRDDCARERSRLRVELKLEREKVENLTFQLTRQTMDLRRDQERNRYLEEGLRRLLVRRDDEYTPLGYGGTLPGVPCDCGWNSGCLLHPGMRLSNGTVVRTGNADSNYDARSHGKKEPEESEFHMERGQCKMSQRRSLQVEPEDCQIEQCRAELTGCQQEHGTCQAKSHSCQTEHRQWRCHNEQDMLATEQKLGQVERCMCQREQKPDQEEQTRNCQTERTLYPLHEEGNCQMKPRERCQVEQRKFQVERASCQLKRNWRQNEQDNCQIGNGPYHVKQKRKQTEGQCQIERRHCGTNDDERCRKEQIGLDDRTNNPNKLYDRTGQSENNIPTDQNGGTVLGGTNNPCDSDGETGLRGTNNLYNPDDGTGLRETNNSYNLDNKTGLKGIKNPFNLDDKTGQKGTNNPYNPDDKIGLKRTYNPFDLDDETGLKGTSNPFELDDQTGLKGTNNPFELDDQTGQKGTNNPYNPDDKIGLKRSNNPFDLDDETGLKGNNNSFNLDNETGQTGTNNTCDLDGKAGQKGTNNQIGLYDRTNSFYKLYYISTDPNDGTVLRGTNNPYHPNGETGLSKIETYILGPCLIEAKVLPRKLCSHELEPGLRQLEQNPTETEPPSQNDSPLPQQDPTVSYLDHQTSVKTVPETAVKNEYENYPDVRNPRVEASYKGPFLVQCHTQNSSDRDQTLFLAPCRSLSENVNHIDPTGGTGLRETINPYDPDRGRSWLGGINNLCDLYGEVGLIGISNPYDLDGGLELRRGNNLFDPECGSEQQENKNPSDLDDGTGLRGIKNPRDEKDRRGLGGIEIFYDPDNSSEEGTSQTSDPDYNKGTSNTRDQKDRIGLRGTNVSVEPETRPEQETSNANYPDNNRSGIKGTSNPHDPGSQARFLEVNDPCNPDGVSELQETSDSCDLGIRGTNNAYHSDDRSGLRGTIDPGGGTSSQYVPDGGSGLSGTNDDPSDQDTESGLTNEEKEQIGLYDRTNNHNKLYDGTGPSKTNIPTDPNDGTVLRGTNIPYSADDGTGPSETNVPTDSVTELRGTNNPYHPDCVKELGGTNNPSVLGSGSGLTDTKNPYNPAGGIGVSGTTNNPSVPGNGSGLTDTKNPYNPAGGIGVSGTNNPVFQAMDQD